MTIVERMARAMAEVSGDPWDSAGAGLKSVLADFALAALEAIKEPSEGMIEAGLKEVSDCTVREPKATAWDALRFHRAMIQAAIDEHKRGATD